MEGVGKGGIVVRESGENTSTTLHRAVGVCSFLSVATFSRELEFQSIYRVV